METLRRKPKTDTTQPMAAPSSTTSPAAASNPTPVAASATLRSTAPTVATAAAPDWTKNNPNWTRPAQATWQDSRPINERDGGFNDLFQRYSTATDPAKTFERHFNSIRDFLRSNNDEKAFAATMPKLAQIQQAFSGLKDESAQRDFLQSVWLPFLIESNNVNNVFGRMARHPQYVGQSQQPGQESLRNSIIRRSHEAAGGG